MKTLKTVSTLIFIILIYILSIPKAVAFAGEVTFYRVLKDDVYIYSDSNLLEPIFCVPKTYYVKAEESINQTVKVSYGEANTQTPVIVGYMNLNDLTPSNTIPNNPYAIIKVSTDTSDILFNDINLKNPYFNVNKNEILYYFGDAINGDNVLCYVYYSNKLGYIDKSCLNPFSITPNQDPIISEGSTETPPDDIPPDTTQTINIGENLQIIIIVGISIVSISVVYFLFKPQKFKTTDEQNEFMSE